MFLLFSVTGRDMAWKFVKDNWDELHNRYEGGFLLSRLIKVEMTSFFYIMISVVGWIYYYIFCLLNSRKLVPMNFSLIKRS